MLQYPSIDPVAVSIGSLKIHWYGIMYLVGFFMAWFLGRIRAKRSSQWGIEEIEDLIFYAALGVVLGGRIGYILFYNFGHFLDNPIILFQVWKGGMSFHGGLLGVLFAMWWYARKTQRSFFMVTDFIAPLVPLGLAAGRLGNFINAELWGRPTDVAWAMIFPTDPLQLARHPSMLYELVLEGGVLFIILWIYSQKSRPVMAISSLFLIFYGSFRFIIEFFRQPDAHLSYIAFNWLTMGMLLSLPMILLGVGMYIFSIKNNKIIY